MCSRTLGGWNHFGGLFLWAGDRSPGVADLIRPTQVFAHPSSNRGLLALAACVCFCGEAAAFGCYGAPRLHSTGSVILRPYGRVFGQRKLKYGLHSLRGGHVG